MYQKCSNIRISKKEKQKQKSKIQQYVFFHLYTRQKNNKIFKMLCITLHPNLTAGSYWTPDCSHASISCFLLKDKVISDGVKHTSALSTLKQNITQHLADDFLEVPTHRNVNERLVFPRETMTSLVKS